MVSIHVNNNSLYYRIWDVENKRKQKNVLVHKSRERGGRSVITATCYSPDAKFIAGGINFFFI